MAYSIGDRILARRKGKQIISKNDDDFDELIRVTIIGKSDDHYLGHLAGPYDIKTAWLAGEDDLAIYGFDEKYLMHVVIFLNEDKIDGFQTDSDDGMNCSCCDEFNIYAGPNQPDGTMICWSCRQNPFRSSFR